MCRRCIWWVGISESIELISIFSLIQKLKYCLNRLIEGNARGNDCHSLTLRLLQEDTTHGDMGVGMVEGRGEGMHDGTYHLKLLLILRCGCMVLVMKKTTLKSRSFYQSSTSCIHLILFLSVDIVIIRFLQHCRVQRANISHNVFVVIGTQQIFVEIQNLIH